MSVPVRKPRTGLRPALVGLAALASLLVLAAAGAAGWAIRAGTSAEPAPPPRPHRVQLGPVGLTAAAEWVREPVSATGVPGLDERSAVAFSPVPGLRAHALVTLLPADDPTLVPAPLRAMLSEPLPAPARASLAGLPAWRYPPRPLTGGRTLEVTAAATTAGVLAVSCIAPSESWVGARGCAAGAGEMQLADAGWLAPSADLAVRGRMPAVIGGLNERRVALRGRLREADGRRGQSRLAARLARAHARTAKSLAPGAPSSGPVREAIGALGRTAGAYRRLSAAAANGWPRRYRRAVRSIRRSEAGLRRALAQLR